jgi:hypothetical protein
MPDPARKTAEWRLLQLLCGAAVPPSLRAGFCGRLSALHFADAANCIVFEEIRSMTHSARPCTAQDLCEQLPSRVTRRGFPDVDFENLLTNDTHWQEDAGTQILRAYEDLVSMSNPARSTLASEDGGG